jgi:hypothetical protein
MVVTFSDIPWTLCLSDITMVLCFLNTGGGEFQYNGGDVF